MKEFYLVEKKDSDEDFIFLKESPMYESGLSLFCIRTPNQEYYEAIKPKNEEDYEVHHYEPYEIYGRMADEWLEKLQEKEETIVYFNIEDIQYLIILISVCDIPKNVKFVCQQTCPFSVNGLKTACELIKRFHVDKYKKIEDGIYEDLSYGDDPYDVIRRYYPYY